MLFLAADLGSRIGDKLQRAFENSNVVCYAYLEGRLVGASRAITDGEYHALIYDVAVLPEFQRQGIGRRMMEELLARLPVWRVMLVSDGDTDDFYARFGFAPFAHVLARFDRTRLFDLQE
jgi:aralkylamine N-acetyltransferase